MAHKSSKKGKSQTKWYINPCVEDSLQFFKEERLDGAVYNLYLKKVRYHTPDDVRSDADIDSAEGKSKFYLSHVQADEDDSEEHKAHLQWRLEEVRVIKGGSLDRLVEALSSATGEVDSTYVNVFLATYRSFASPKQVLNLLLARYRSIGEDPTMKQQKKEAHQKTIKTVVSVWMDSYSEDFREPPNFPCLRHVIQFSDKHMRGTDIAKRAKAKIDTFIREEEPQGPVGVDDVSLEFHINLLQDVAALPASMLSRPVDFENIPVSLFAQQLTYVDAELFKKVVPHHCLGSIWSRRDKKNDKAPSVNATVNQFNAVAHVVIAIVLKWPDLPATERARVMEKWIDIAQECRVYKNFSSLKAILAGLQSNPVYRLHKVWDQIDREKMDLFEELSEIYSEEHNQTMIRELLNREGTAKFADPESTNTIRGHKRQRSGGWTATWGKRKSASYFEVPQIVQGTVPYLGTFLTDLNMVDTANPNTTKEGLINFDKKRKEFEILAQIRLLQSAASMYRIQPDAAFFEWFHSLRIYDDSESHDLSCEIEPETPSTPVDIKGHRKKSSLGFFSPRRPSESTLSSPAPSVTDIAGSMDCLDIDVDNRSVYSNPDSQSPISGPRPTNLRHSISSSMVGSMEGLDINTSPWKSQETCVVKVFMESADKKATTFYKSIMLNNCDHTKTVISNILLKYDISGQPDDYVIFQVMPEKELQIPDKGNVFYAINTSVPELRFVIRKKSELERLKAKRNKGRTRLKKVTL